MLKPIKIIDQIFMDIKRKLGVLTLQSFYSNEMIIAKKSLYENQIKFTYQKQLISDLAYKHSNCQNLLAFVFRIFH